jgi:hypothetical protein
MSDLFPLKIHEPTKTEMLYVCGTQTIDPVSEVWPDSQKLDHSNLYD